MNSPSPECAHCARLHDPAVVDSHYRQLLEAAPTPILVHTVGGIAFANAAAAQALGTTPEAMVGRSILDFIHPDSRGELLSRMRAAHGPLPLARQKLLRADGQVVVADVCSRPFVFGDSTAVLTVAQDVTAQVRANERVRALFRAMPIPTFAWQAQRVGQGGATDFVLVDYNDAALTATRGAAARLLGSRASDVFGDRPDILDDLGACLGSGQPIRRAQDFALVGTSDVRHWRVTFAPGPDGLVLVHAEDATDQQRLEDQLRQAQKMEAIGRLAGGIAHDFNNLLSVILSYATFLLDDLPPAHPMHADVGEILLAGQRAAGLTRQLLAFSRQQVLSPRAFVLHDAVRRTQRMLARVLGEDIRLTVRGTAGAVFADAVQVDQVLLNLAVNARDAMPRGGQLTIEVADVDLDEAGAAALAAAPGPYVRLTVSDTGHGMDAATRGRIFEPFFTTKPKGHGTGMGLATVFGIVKQSGGHITVTSEPGRGTTFAVYLPRVGGGQVRAAPAEVAPQPQRGTETVLVVDDEPLVRRAVCATLARAGYRVLEAEGPGEALLLVEQHAAPIDLLLADVVMPRMSGPQLADRLTSARPELRVLLMSGYAGDVVAHHGASGAGRAFLPKPVRPPDLVGKVRAVLDAHA